MEGEKNIRVRFAPSPTGFLHLGSARTALFNWLYARHTGGKLILRVEDTDRERSKKEFLDEILQDLKWLGLDWDEGPHYQSERLTSHREYAERLCAEDKAYREGEAIILKVKKGRDIEINDVIHGKITVNTDQVKDQVLMKSDGTSAYNFACVADDHDMGITHIVRGDDHISNTPKQILIYEALDFDIPQFAHMPLLMGKDGAKLSKRHGAVAVEEYKKEGFLPEALANYLLLLGWSPGDNKELITLAEAAGIFEIKDIGNVQARFDADKLRWINGEYLRAKSNAEIFDLVKDKFVSRGYIRQDDDNAYALEVIGLFKARSRVLDDIVEFAHCFFKDNFKIDEKGFKKHISGDENKSILRSFRDKLLKLDEFTLENTEETCRKLADKLNVKAAKIIHPTRVAISGKTVGAGLFEMMVLLGKERCIQRIDCILQVTAVS